MERQRIPSDVKRRIIMAHEAGDDYIEAARVLGVKRGTAYSIVHRYILEGVIERPRGGRRHQKMDEDMANTVVEIVESQPEFTLAQIKADLQARMPDKPSVSIQTISTCLRNRLIFLKKMETVQVNRNSHDVKVERAEYANWYLHTINANHPPTFIFVDESGFNLWISRTRGRARRGERAVRIVHGQRGRNFTLILAVSNEGVVHHEFYEGGTSCERFNSWLEEASVAAGAGPRVFVMDNAPCHNRAREVSLREGHSIRYLPPYSPFLNIAENAFSMWKAAFKREVAEIREQLHNYTGQQRNLTLLQLASQNMSAITANKMGRSSRRMGRLMPRLINREDVLQNHQ